MLQSLGGGPESVHSRQQRSAAASTSTTPGPSFNHRQNVADCPAEAKGAHRARERGVRGGESPLWPWEKEM